MYGKLTNAVVDARYLLYRGYSRESVVRFVGDRYALSREERLIIYRGVYDPVTALSHRRKKVGGSFLADKVLSVDGFNVLITVEAAIEHKPLLACDDGFIRDISAVHGHYVLSEKTLIALNAIAEHLLNLGPRYVYFFYDSPVSHSGEIASLTERTISGKGLKCSSKAVKQVDVEVVKSGEVTASSDFVIISKSQHVYDLGGEVAVKHFNSNVLKF